MKLPKEKPKTQSELDTYFMQIALNEAQKAYKEDEIPIGAVLVDKINNTIYKAHNQTEKYKNITYHAELIVINKVIKKLKLKHLHNLDKNYTLYTTLEPCPMCAGAIMLSKIDRIVISAKDPKSGAAGSVLNILQNPQLNHYCNITFGILENESSQILKSFFKSKRIKNLNRNEQ